MVVKTADGKVVKYNVNKVTEVTFEEAEPVEWIDLGLPSGTLWATMNVGASSPEDYGDYFAWGETETKDNYTWETYKYCMGSETTMTKYCGNSKYGYNGFTDTLTELLPEDDAATKNWGANWQMPSREQMAELINSEYTAMIQTSQNGVYGRMFTSKINGNSIFLPYAYYRYGTRIPKINDNFYGYYWSRSLNTTNSYNGICLGFYNFKEAGPHNEVEYRIFIGNEYRYYGYPVRPVVKQ